MKWSWKVGKLSGIEVYIHATFILLVAFLGYSYWMQTRTLGGTLEGLGFLLALFLSVVLHEYGHALTARRYGIKTRDITLLPIGGVARLERMPEKPLQELWVALAGPAVNIGIAAILLFYLFITNTFAPVTDLTLTGGPFVERLMTINFTLALFNLIPAFPMDGGRVLRALLALRLDYLRATQIASGIGQGMALLFGIIGLFTNPFLLFIAFFVWIGAQQEASLVQIKSGLGGIPVGKAMQSDFQRLNISDTLHRAAQLILQGSQQDFPVVDGDKIVGILTRNRLMFSLSKNGENTEVSREMDTKFEVVHPSDMLEPVFMRLQSCACHFFPVVQDGKLMGLLSMENIGEYMMIQSALGTRGIRQGAF